MFTTGTTGRLVEPLSRSAGQCLPATRPTWRGPLSTAFGDQVARLPYDGRIRHVRDEAFLAWRFANPLHEYRYLYAGESTLDGYLVLQRFVAQPISHQVSIVDLEANDQFTRNALLDAAIRLGRFTELSIRPQARCRSHGAEGSNLKGTFFRVHFAIKARP